MGRYALRSFLFVALLAIGVAGPALLTIILVIGYSLIYAGPEVILIGFAMDAYFAYGSGMWYRYTLICGVIVFLATVLRPYLSVYNRS